MTLDLNSMDWEMARVALDRNPFTLGAEAPTLLPGM